MLHRGFQAIKRFSIGQLASYVERRELNPLPDVDRSTSIFTQLLN